MSDNRGKILGTIVFVVLISVLIYLIFFMPAKNRMEKIEFIEITGNSLLKETQYLEFTRLMDLSSAEGITLPVIRDRFEKHPYVAAAEVELSGSRRTKVLLHEKRIMAVLLVEPEAYFLADNFQILPVLLNTKLVDVPVISNPGFTKAPRPLSYVKTGNILQAFRIIDAVHLTSDKLSASLSEINLRSGGDIILSFSGLNAPVIFGKNSAANKIVYLETLWDKLLNGKGLMQNSDYVDLRFANEIFIGTAVTAGLIQ
jgi:cell division septal protein FtsQ